MRSRNDREQLTMTLLVTEQEIDAAAKAYCCPDCDCIPSMSYCAKTHFRDIIRRVLVAAARARTDGEEQSR